MPLPRTHETTDAAAPPVTPKVVVSQCLGFAAVRYDGERLESGFVEALRAHVDFVQVCPEVGIGLGVPRDPIRIEVVGGERRLVQPSTGRDLTGAMNAFADGFLGGLDGADGFILKSRSPSCGIVDTKIFGEAGDDVPLERDAGLFAEAVLERFPWAAVQDEARLTDPRHRHRFLTHLWALARLRRIEARHAADDLAAFHAGYEYLLEAYGRDRLRRLRRLAKNPEGRAPADAVDAYRAELGRTLAEPPGQDDLVEAVRVGFDLSSRESERRRKPGFEPYPRSLLSPSGSGAGRP